jgi:hypothetical protein
LLNVADADADVVADADADSAALNCSFKIANYFLGLTAIILSTTGNPERVLGRDSTIV